MPELTDEMKKAKAEGTEVAKAVSYTHLDVYKRQPKHRPYLEAFLANCPKLQKVWMLQKEVEDLPSGVYSINAVSYTHLDVYKRQP